ncbi:MAG: DUF1850 domain-containing protein, partial [Termitinemataceae bacterium]
QQIPPRTAPLLSPIIPKPDQHICSCLVIKRNNSVCAMLPLPKSGEFRLTYTHSIHKRPVEEYYRAENGKLHLYLLRYDTTSTGMPFDAEEGFEIQNGMFVLHMDRWFSEIVLWISPIPGHGVIIEGRSFLFTDWAPPEEALSLSVTVCNSQR